MHQSLLRGALLAAILLPCAPVVRAQGTAPAAAGVAVAPGVTGFDLLKQAGALIEYGPNGKPTAREALAPDENLRRQRLAVARNAPALARLRQALAAGIAVPGGSEDPDFIGNNLTPLSQARELARLLAQEAAVRVADGDALGAAQSDLDAMRLGAQVSGGVFINSLNGSAIAIIARRSLELHARALDADESRTVAAQLEAIVASRATYADSLRAEKAYGTAQLRGILAPMADPVKRGQFAAELAARAKAGDDEDEGPNDDDNAGGGGDQINNGAKLGGGDARTRGDDGKTRNGVARRQGNDANADAKGKTGDANARATNGAADGGNAADEAGAAATERALDAQMASELAELTPAEIEADFADRYDQAIERTALPYNIALSAGPIAGRTVYVDVLAGMIFPLLSRFSSERDATADRLFIGALQLRAFHLETGEYPETFDAGLDPFSAELAPLVYKRVGDSYLLYSVGPDGTDDGGADVQTIETNNETGADRVTDIVRANSTGDIVAPAL